VTPRLARLNAGLHRATCAASVALLAAIFAIMVLQIAFRYVLNAPLVWTEEAARYLYIWATIDNVDNVNNAYFVQVAGLVFRFIEALARSRDHERLRRRTLLPRRAAHPRADGRVPVAGPGAALRAVRLTRGSC
jgi:hypothetical protein